MRYWWQAAWRESYFDARRAHSVHGEGVMAAVMEAIEIDVPAAVAYAQWSRLEDLPLYAEGVNEVRRLDGRRSRWRANILGVTQSWDAEVVQMLPDRWVAWRSTTGAEHQGSVTLEWLGPAKTRVTIRIDYTPHGFIEGLGDVLGAMEGRVYRTLRRFKRYIEAHAGEVAVVPQRMAG